MNKQLIDLVKEIIYLCDNVINDGDSPNYEVVRILKHEFEKQYISIIQEDKVIVLNKQKDLWSTRTIIDSGNFAYDKVLFDKIFAFGDLCRKLPLDKLVILYK